LSLAIADIAWRTRRRVAENVAELGVRGSKERRKKQRAAGSGHSKMTRKDHQPFRLENPSGGFEDPR
jgi:hypothetical protein